MKHQLFATSLLGLGMCAAIPHANAQTADRKWGVSGYVSTLQYRGDLGSNFWDFRNLNYGGGLTLTRYLNSVLDVNLSGNQGQMYYPADGSSFTGTGQVTTNNRRFYANLTTIGLGFKIKVIPNSPVVPYLIIQPGFAYVYSNRYAAGSNVNSRTNYGSFDGMAGAGIDFHFTPGFGIFIQGGQHVLLRDDDRLDGVADANSGFLQRYDRYMQFSGGLTASFGKAKDTDGDGVPDRKDKCPDTPQGVKVDANGCPLDTDGDGIPDYQDKCPDVKGLAALQGCPDSDNDGVADADDKCPNTPAGVKVDATGCPLDSDGDGVPDYLDKCPGTPAGVKVDATGCPLDSDGDGVPDYQDRCPDRAGPASNKGCPEIPAEKRKILQEATKYINFDFNKATLKPSSYTRLNQMVAIMNEYPDYSLSIAGHTDDKGSEAYNLRLSYERAAAARRYMLEHGVAAERIESRGYGKLHPVASNATEAGRALNRRVEYDPYLTGEPNPAETKYGPAPSIAELKEEGKKLPGTKTTGTGAPRSRKAPMQKAPVRKK